LKVVSRTPATTATYSDVRLNEPGSIQIKSPVTRCGIHPSCAPCSVVFPSVLYTSVRQIEAHYGNFILDFSHAISRRLLLDAASLVEG
jgi:hypothetical protein